MASLFQIVALSFLYHTVASNSSPIFFIVAPNVFRVNTQEVITMSLYGDVEELNLRIYLQDFPEKKHNFSAKNVQVNNHAISNVTLKLSVEDALNLPDNSHYIYLTAQSTSTHHPFKQISTLLLNFSPGFIFIQTDKPLYNPGQIVNIRVIPVDEESKPVSWPIQVDIVNPDKVTVSRSQKDNYNSFISETLRIPDYPVFGNYTVTASFVNGLRTSSSIRFEVKEYVLPVYTVSFETEEKFRVVLPDHQCIKSILNARYVFGKAVRGHVTLSYGLVWHGHIFTLGKQRNIQLSINGQAEVLIYTNDLKAAAQSMWFPSGGRLFIEAAVTEEASGRIEFAMDQSIIFASFPYILKFTRCSQYFKPGLPYVIHVDAVRANGQSAANLPLTILGQGSVKEKTLSIHPLISENALLYTDVDGRLTTTILLPTEIKTLTVIVKTSIKGLSEENQTNFYFTAMPYYSPSDTYISVRALSTRGSSSAIPSVGEFISVETVNTEPNYLEDINLMVISKGKILYHRRTKALTGDKTNFYIPVTSAMSPSSRILTYAMRGTLIGCEVVADATWLEIQEKCSNEVFLQTTSDVIETYKPGDEVVLTLYSNAKTKVGLLAVDRSVYILKNQKFTRSKIFAAMKEHDTGCGFGGGRDSAFVFHNSGLTTITNADLRTETKVSDGCTDKPVRRKRSVDELIKEICCRKGYRLSEPLSYQNGCFDIARFIENETNSSICADEFYNCCRHGPMEMAEWKGRLQNPIDGFFKEEQLVLEDIPLRTNFPESWLFKEYDISMDESTNITFNLPDTITTWVIEAVSLSEEHGICVSKPLNITVFTKFFVHLDIPYSTVRLEQIEVRAVIYNYMNLPLSVKIVLQSVAGICYAGAPGENSEMSHLDIPPNDAASISFPVIPLEIGHFPVRLYVYSAWGNDAVEKMLFVEGEGMEKIHTVSAMLDPSGKRLIRENDDNATFDLKNEVDKDVQRQKVQVDLDLPYNTVPETEKCTVSAIGNILGPTVSGFIHGVDTILKLPTGCGEQNLIHLAPNVYVMRYLRATNRLLPEVEKKARVFMRQGLMRQLKFRKLDGSFATWPHAVSSTWLTAFALKVITQAKSFIAVDNNITCQALEWLLKRQNDDGSFREDNWVMHKEMLGGTTGETTLAAFILIAILESDCKPQGMENINQYKIKTISFLENKLQILDRPLAVAMTTYSLALAYSPIRVQANEVLKNMSQKSADGFVFWGIPMNSSINQQMKQHWFNNEPSSLAVEATAYALLAQLEMGEIQYSNHIVGWLLQQRGSHGSFVSTQDTVIGLQALSEYSIRTYSAILDMTCQITSEADQNFQKLISLRHEDALVLKSVPKVPTGGKLVFEAAGTGVGIMQVEVRYNIPQEGDACKFDVSVESHRLSHLVYQFFNHKIGSECAPCDESCTEKDDDIDDSYETFTFPSIIPRIQRIENSLEQRGNAIQSTVQFPYSRIGRPLRRVRKSVSARNLCINVCVRYRGSRATGMSVLDVGLFTGYQPIDADLIMMKLNSKIQHYEKSQRSVILYLEEISHKNRECFKFRAKQKHVVENIQPAQVQVYDYYKPDERCTYFYKPNNVSGHLTNFCDDKKSICQCLEGRCSRCEDSWYGKRWLDLIHYACENSTYVLQIKILDIQSDSTGFERVLATVQRIFYTGGNNVLKTNDKLILLKRSSCMCPQLSLSITYTMIASEPKRFNDNDNHIYAFLMDKMTFVLENHRFKQRNKLTKQVKFLSRQLRRFQKRIMRKGCPKNNRKEG